MKTLLEHAALEQTKNELRQKLLNEIIDCMDAHVPHFLQTKAETWRNRVKQIDALNAIEKGAAEPDGKSKRVQLLIQ